MLKGSIPASMLASLLCFTSLSFADSEGDQPSESFLSDPIEESAISLSEEQQPIKNAKTADCARGFKHMRISARHIEGKGIGYNKGYTTLEAFLAPDQERHFFMPFLDLRGHAFNDGKYAANAGIGTRWKEGCRAYGVNVYYDYRNDRKGFNQVGFGAESLGERWDFRVNGYLPVGNKVSRPYNTRFGSFTGNNLMLSRKYEFTMKGADAEGGAHFGSRDYNFFCGAGPYYFDGQMGPHTWGGKARVFGSWKEYIGLQVSFSYDNLFHGIAQGEISFNLPLGPKPKVKANTKHCNTTCRTAERLDRRMVQPVIRDEIIVLNKQRKQTPAINPLTGDPFAIFFVNNTSHSLGTYESPFNTLADAQNASGPGDIIYVFPGDNTSTGMASGIVLQDSQQLLGSTSSYVIQTTLGPITIGQQSFGEFLPVLANSSGAVVTLANNNVVSGFNIQNLNGHGIYGSGVNNFNGTNNFIQGVGSSNSYNGVELDNSTGVITFSNNTVMNQNSCFYINNTSPISNTSYALTNNIIDNNGGSNSIGAVNLSFNEGSNNSFVFTDNQITGSAEYGVRIICTNTSTNLSTNFIIENNQIFASYFPFSITMTGTAANLNVNGNFMTSGEYGFSIDLSGSSNVTTSINNNTFSSLYYTLYAELSDSTLNGTISNNTVHAWDDDEVLYLSSNGSSSMNLNIFNNAFIGGYQTDVSNSSTGPDSSIIFQNNSFASASFNLLEVDNSGSANLNVEILGNTFRGFVTNGLLVNQSGTGTLSLVLDHNTSNLFPNAFLLEQSAGTFNLKTPIGNLGQLAETGTITPN